MDDSGESYLIDRNGYLINRITICRKSEKTGI